MKRSSIAGCVVGAGAMIGLLVIAASSCRPNLATIRIPAFENTDPGRVLTAGEMGRTIQMGVVVAGWRVVAAAPGRMLAAVEAGGHSATVSIRYNEVSYVIERHETSPGLKYDEAHQFVHHRYNFWVDRLDRSIQQELNRSLAEMIGRSVGAGGGPPRAEVILRSQVEAARSSAEPADGGAGDE